MAIPEAIRNQSVPKVDSQGKNLADFINLPEPSKDIFAKTLPFYGFMQDITEKQYNHWSRELVGPSANRVMIHDKYTGSVREMIMMASNNYLGLTTHPKVVKAGMEAQRDYGAGAGSVPLLAGTNDIHRELELKLAKFKGCEDAMIFTSGYSSNVGIVSALVRETDVALNDRLNHASIIDGCRLSGGSLRAFRHNDMESLEKALAHCRKKYDGILLVVDGVFSMDGDIADLPKIKELADEYGARVMIDEAHASGVLGSNGRGTPEHFGMEGEIDIVAGTLSKALGVVGGFVASSKEVINYLRFYARSNMFSTAMTPAAAGSLVAALDVIQTEPELRERLWYNIRYMIDNLKALGLDLGNAETAIIPIIIPDEDVLRDVSRYVHSAGVFVNPVYYPAVPKGLSRLRLSLMATHTQEDLDTTLGVIEDAVRKYGVI